MAAINLLVDCVSRVPLTFFGVGIKKIEIKGFLKPH